MQAARQTFGSDDCPTLRGPATTLEPATAVTLSTGIAPFDRLLAGGLRPGELVELYGQRSGGRFSIALAAIAVATAGGKCAALVDLGDSLDPQSAAAVGVDLRRLLWVRPRSFDQALASVEALAGSGVPLVVVDLGMPPITRGRGGEEVWKRLARSAREHRVALLVSSPFRISGDAAEVAIEAFQPLIRWRSRADGAEILGGLSSRLELRSVTSEGEFGDAGPQNLTLNTSDALAGESGDNVRILEFPFRDEKLPSYRSIA